MGNRKTGIAIGCAICGLNLFDAILAVELLVPLGFAEAEGNPIMVIGYSFMGEFLFVAKVTMGIIVMAACCFCWKTMWRYTRIAMCVSVPAYVLVVVSYLPLMLR